MSEPTTAVVPAAPGSLDLSAAIQTAASLGKDGVEVLERLHAIAKEERAANAKAAWVAAMARFRAEMPAVTKTVEGQHGTTRAGTRTKGMYAPLDSITPILDPIIARHGLTYRFDRETREGKDYVVCFVTHAQGHEESSRFPAPADTGPGRTAIQAIASGESYAKRYALVAAFGITTADPDDDGRGGEDAQRVTPEQAATVQSLIEETGANVEAFKKTFRIQRIDDLRLADHVRAVRMLEQKRKQAAQR